jgi:PIN domain nuclease of toxin-antitoxin system
VGGSEVTADPPLLLDTCAAIWVSEAQPLANEALTAIERSHRSGEFIYVSAITAWEVGLLVSRGKLTSPMSPQRWFERLLEAPGVRLADMSPDVLIASSFLPGAPPRDPADRILASTAREYGYRLMTRDTPLLTYARQGHLQALAC